MELTKEDGMKLIKPAIIDLIFNLYFHNSISNLEKLKKCHSFFIKLLEFEIKRWVNIHTCPSEDYINYFFDKTLSLINWFYYKIYGNQQQDYYESDDFYYLETLGKEILGKLYLLHGHLTLQHSHILIQFIENIEQNMLDVYLEKIKGCKIETMKTEKSEDIKDENYFNQDNEFEEAEMLENTWKMFISIINGSEKKEFEKVFIEFFYNTIN